MVILGLVYGYVPYMILPLYAGLDRLPQSTLEAARDLGANRVSAFVRVILPMCRTTIVAAVLLTCLPMLGDYYTNDLLSGSPKTSMVGNLINETVLTPGQTGYAGAFRDDRAHRRVGPDALLHPVDLPRRAGGDVRRAVNAHLRFADDDSTTVNR